MLEQSALQHTFSSCIDSHILNSLLNNPALPTTEKARLRAVSAAGAARWLSAAPNFKNFKYFESNQFSVALRYWLGIPKFNSTCKCRCGQIIDVFGDHATTCKVGGGPIHRHDLIRDAIFECCNMAGISPSKEITGYQAGQKDRVGDVVLNSFDHVREMLVDVTCWSPLYLPRIQHSAASSKYTVSEAHSFKLKSRNTNQEGQIKTTKGMVAFMPFALLHFWWILFRSYKTVALYCPRNVFEAQQLKSVLPVTYINQGICCYSARKQFLSDK